MNYKGRLYTGFADLRRTKLSPLATARQRSYGIAENQRNRVPTLVDLSALCITSKLIERLSYSSKLESRL
jgi:hypothetical protein